MNYIVMDTIFNYPWVIATIVGFLLVGVIGKAARVSFARIAKWYLYIAAFSVVIVATSILFPFIGGKDYFFRFSVELSLACAILWWAFEARAGEVKQRLATTFKNPIVIAVSLFVLMFVLASLFGYDPQAAFWSNYERGEGGFQMIHYYLFFALLSLFLVEEEDWRTMFKSSLVSAVLMILYGIAGNFSLSGFIGPYSTGTSPVGLWHQLIDGRFQVSLGNPAYVAPYLIFTMVFAAYLWLSEKRFGMMTRAKEWGYGILIAIFFVFFILSQTRGAFLGLGAGILVFLCYLIATSKGGVRKWSLGILVTLAVLFGGVYAARNTEFVQRFPESRLLQLSLSDTSAQTRVWVWGEAWKGFLDRPILGWGPENFTVVYDKYFDPRFFIPGVSTETWFDRAHSVFFDYLAETGILGFLTYLGMFATFYYQFIKKRRNNGEATHQMTTAMYIERGLLFAVPVAYLGQGIALFDVFPIYLSVFLFLAFAGYYLTNHHKIHAR